MNIDSVRFNKDIISGYCSTDIKLSIDGLVDENNNLVMDREKFFEISGLEFSKEKLKEIN